MIYVMSELNIVIALAIIYAILWMAKHKVFMFQRTIRKIALNSGIPQKKLGFLYPQKYKTLHIASNIRWVILGVILFLSWEVAIGLLVLGGIVTMVYPEQDDFVNIKKILDDLQRNGKGIDNEVLNATRSMLGDILSELDPEKGWGMIGRILYIKCDDDFVKGEVVNICHLYKEYDKYPYVVIFEKEVGINNSFPQKEHFLYKNEIDDIVNWRLMGSYIHFRF
jgi:hypothetical protein